MKNPYAPAALILTCLMLVACGGTLPPARSASPASDVSDTMLASADLVVQVVQTQSGMGTGLVVGTDGLVLTNEHVVKIICEEMEVAEDPSKPDEKTKKMVCSSGTYQVCSVLGGYQSCTPADLLAVDADLDLALLRAKRTFKREAVFGDDTVLAPAEKVYAWINVGLILPPTLFLGRYANRIDPRYVPVGHPILVFDLSMNHGGSGGPVFNLKDEVIAIFTGFTRITNDPNGFDNGSPLGVSVPSTQITHFLESTGQWKRPALVKAKN